MATQPNPPSNRQRTARARRRARRQSSSSTSATPTATDMRRYMDWRAGISVAELAARENVRLGTIEASIQRTRSFAAENSSEMTEIAVRRVAREVLPEAKQVIEGAMSATRYVPFTTGYDDEGNPLTEYRETVDHQTRLEAVDRVRALFTAAQPKTPMVAVNNSNTVNMQNNLHALGAAGQLSAEAVIRQIRAERGLALPSETSPEQAAAALVEHDMELKGDLEDSAEDGDEADSEADSDDEYEDEEPLEPEAEKQAASESK